MGSMEKSITVNADEVPAVFAALSAMVLNNHFAQDNLTKEDRAKAEAVFQRFSEEMERRK